MSSVRRLRYKMLLLFLPLVVTVVAASGGLSFLEFQTELTRLANHHLAYKAEQLRDYLYSEWGVVQKLKLEDSPLYRDATRRSFRSYAASLLRDDTERVVALGPNGTEISVGLKDIAETVQADPLAADLPASGWFSVNWAGEGHVGVSFTFPPFGWKVALFESSAEFLSPLQSLLATHLWILVGSVAAAALLTLLYIGRIVGPVERLTATIETVTASRDLGRRVFVEFRDEIGMLAYRFNAMLQALEVHERDLIESGQAERRAKEAVLERETETLWLLGRVSEVRDEETGAHLSRIGLLSALFSRLLGQSEAEQDLIRQSSPLHDIGKIGIPDAILSKPGKLDEEEITVMRRHTLFGYDLLKDSASPYLVEGASIALHHHEQWGGTGYPRGLKGEQIPLSSRIVCLVDVFDALLSSRPYKTPWPAEQVREYLRNQRGTYFEPRLVDAFDEHFDQLLALWQSLSG